MGCPFPASDLQTNAHKPLQFLCPDGGRFGEITRVRITRHIACSKPALNPLETIPRLTANR